MKTIHTIEEDEVVARQREDEVLMWTSPRYYVIWNYNLELRCFLIWFSKHNYVFVKNKVSDQSHTIHGGAQEPQGGHAF